MNNNGMKKRWISLYVENQVGVLSKISGLFSGKSYNLDSLTVGTTEDPTVSRMTIATVSDDETFEQIKKQLNRLVEVIKVIDFTDVFVRMKEILYVKVRKCSKDDKVECFQIAETFKAKIIDYGNTGSLFFNYDLLGYAFMALSTFFGGFLVDKSKKCGKPLAIMLKIHGIFFLSCLFVPMFPVFTGASGDAAAGTVLLEIWCLYFMPICFFGYRYFGDKDDA